MTDPLKARWARTYGILGAAAFQLVGAVVGMALLGNWLDAKWSMTPLLTVIFAVLGSVGGFWNLWRMLQWKERQDAKEEKEKVQ